MKMKAIMDFPYNQGDVKNGQEFEAVCQGDADLLRLAGRAVPAEDGAAPTESKRRRSGYLRRDQRAA